MVIKLSGAKNMRDFSEYGFKDHIRSAHLHKLKADDIDILVKRHNIKTIIDLRTTQEITDKPDAKMPGVKYLHIPLFNTAMPGISHEMNAEALIKMIPDMPEMYRSLVTDESSLCQIRKVMDAIKKAESDGGVLWHCTEGKDRCGIISALFLLSHGIDPRIVTDDYLMTNKVNLSKAKMFYFLVLLTGRGRSIASRVRDAFLAKREYIEPIMDRLICLSKEFAEKELS